MSRAAPRAARAVRPLRSCWWGRTDVTALPSMPTATHPGETPPMDVDENSGVFETAVRTKKASRETTMSERDYIRDGAEIYRRSFAMIRAESDLSRFTSEQALVVVRIIHACGMVEVAGDVHMASDLVADAPGSALRAGDADPMRIPRWSPTASRGRACRPTTEVICTLVDPRTPVIAAEIGNTRTAAAMELGASGSEARWSPSEMHRRRSTISWI